MSTKFYQEELRGKTEQLWQAVFKHPFVSGIGDGSLSRDRYEFFLKQDYIYLIDFSRVFALAVSKARKLGDMGYFAEILHGILNMEMELHRKTCNSFGIKNDELETTEPAFITSAYTNLLVRSCHEGSLANIVAVLLPCVAGYAEIGQRLKNKGLLEDKFYQDWINTYTSKEFESWTNWLIEKMNLLAENSSEQDRKSWFNLYISSTRFEFLFFDMSWNRELWPEKILL